MKKINKKSEFFFVWKFQSQRVVKEENNISYCLSATSRKLKCPYAIIFEILKVKHVGKYFIFLLKFFTREKEILNGNVTH